jgi:hypothetical protein
MVQYAQTPTPALCTVCFVHVHFLRTDLQLVHDIAFCLKFDCVVVWVFVKAMTLVRMKTLEKLPREASDRLVAAVYKVMSEMNDDGIIPDTQIDIEVGTIEENGNMHLLPSDFNSFFDFSRKEGSQPSAHDGSQPSGIALALYAGEEPGQPADIVLDRPDEHVDFSDVCEPMWRNCVRIAHRKHRVHHTVRSARIIRGKPNHLFREAWLLWQRLPEQIVGKEEKQRQGLKKAYNRRWRENRTAEKCWEDADRARLYNRRWRARHLGPQRRLTA